MALAIHAQGLGKQYQLGSVTGARYRYRSLREDLTLSVRRGGRQQREAARSFWALQDVSFDIEPGERVGIIGRNGAGKSTLLKILARITSPTTGYAEVRGKVGSLLEVGTGFHPELTGLDNVYLSGAILGMRRTEIRSKVDEIVEFAGVERFLDTPVKRYSSGMQLRLAFAVAAHLDTDIMIVDEVLAVGDAEFQKRCLGRMSDISQSGRTIVFVSHSMPAVLRLCDRVILLDGGEVVADGDRHSVIRTYLDSGLGSGAERAWTDRNASPGDDVARLAALRVRSADGVHEEVDIREPLRVEVDYWRMPGSAGIAPVVSLQFTNEDGVCLFHTTSFDTGQELQALGDDVQIRAVCHVPGNFLAEGRVFVSAWLGSVSPIRIHAKETDAVAFHVVDRSDGDGVRGIYVNEWPGVVRPMLEWTLQAPDLVSQSRDGRSSDA